tara:strand:- start:1068 stop:1307 length:240 start_codon:yes stop_codon:yes gene_type:complete
MTKQPEALRLADELESEWLASYDIQNAAEELRRLHGVNQELVNLLKVGINNPFREGTESYNKVIKMVEAAIAKATGEQA